MIRNSLKFRWILVYFLTLLVFSTGYLFLNTQKGLNIAVKLIQHWVPGKLVFTISGRLLGPVEIKNLHYKSSELELSITAAQFDWHWSTLLRGQFHIASLAIDKLLFSINDSHTSSEKTKGFPLWIFKHIQLNSININQALIQYGDNSLTLNGSLQRQWDFNWQLIVPKLKTFIPESKGQIVLEGKLNGNKFTPQFYAELSKANLTWKDWQFREVQGKFQLDGLKTKKWVFNFEVERIKNSNFSLSPIRISFNGNLQPFYLQGKLSRFKLDKELYHTVIHTINLPSFDVSSKLTALGLEAEINSNLSENDQLSAYIHLPKFKLSPDINLDQELQGSVQLKLKSLSFLAEFISMLKNSDGSLVADINLAGSIVSPKLIATLNLQHGRSQIPSLGLLVKNIELSFYTDKNTLFGSGRLNSGDGSLTFQSKTLLDQYNFPSNIDLQGDNVLISDTEEYKITASPKLHIAGDLNYFESTGTIFFPKANIKLNDSNLNLVQLSNDVTFVNHKKKSKGSPFKFTNKLKLKLGSDISFSYQGLSTKITGALDINQSNKHPILATGQLALINGAYTYYGQSLQLQSNSTLNFANSPIDNPILNIRANKQVWFLPDVNKNIQSSKLGSSSFISASLPTNQPVQATVGVMLQGYLENPQINLYADPISLFSSKLEILSYLVTGQPSNQLSGASLQLLLNTATQFGGKEKGLGHFINQAQKKIGIDQITIGASPIFNPNTNSLQQNTSLIIGKNFSPRLNVSYSVGILDPISVLRINYLLNKNYSLQTTSSTFANGIDLLYKIEKK